jgi:uncharacterized protein (TIGR04141 family)
MSNENKKYRLKVYQVKPEFSSFSDENLVKEPSKSERYSSYQSKTISNDIMLFYKKTFDAIPRWYSGFLEQNDKEVYSTNASGYFFRSITNNDGIVTKFAVTFGNGDSALDFEKFENKFGLIIALNLAVNFYSVKKNMLAGTMSNVKEQASRKMDINNFQIDFEKDLVEGITVDIEENDFFVGNITGSVGLSFTTTKSISEIDSILLKLKEHYAEERYKKNFPFIDNINEIKKDQKLIDKINEHIISTFNNNDDNKVWFGLPEIVEWEKIIDFTFMMSQKREKNYNEICFDTVRDFVDTCGHKIEKIEELKKIKILINCNDDYVYDYKWTLLDALYASIEVDETTYVYSGKRYFIVNKDYQKDIDDRFSNIEIDSSPLDENETTKSEGEYLINITKKNNDLVLVDKKCIVLQTPIEPCDIFRKSDKSFIHVKKYGSSSVLSHLFNQAYVSADIFSNSVNARNQIIEKISDFDVDKDYDKDKDKSNHSVIIAIMTVKKLESGEHAKLPFFSKINLVKTIETIKGLGYKNAKVMYIYSSAPLYNKEV